MPLLPATFLALLIAAGTASTTADDVLAECPAQDPAPPTGPVELAATDEPGRYAAVITVAEEEDDGEYAVVRSGARNRGFNRDVLKRDRERAEERPDRARSER